MARYLLTRSEGTIGELAHLLMAAAIVAVRAARKRSTIAHSAWPVDNLSRNQDIAVGLQVILKPRARPTPTWTSMPERTLDFEF